LPAGIICAQLPERIRRTRKNVGIARGELAQFPQADPPSPGYRSGFRKSRIRRFPDKEPASAIIISLQ
jgi:hypothetical protein